mmetsp:Transcript_10018/g.36381  ORF Transcript_10018/g.36381 Transcript_10018/m.36381 type:complete len:224 (+) Transcript_10018:193-864(+)
MSDPLDSSSPHPAQNDASFAKKFPVAAPSPSTVAFHASNSGNDATLVALRLPGGVGARFVQPPSTRRFPLYARVGHPQYNGMWHDDSSAPTRSSKVSNALTSSPSSATGPPLNPTRFSSGVPAFHGPRSFGVVMDTCRFPLEHRSCASRGSSSRSVASRTAPTRPSTPFARQSRRTRMSARSPSSGVIPHAMNAATSAPADAPATGVVGPMRFVSLRTLHAPT